jgi:hypothetical protein
VVREFEPQPQHSGLYQNNFSREQNQAFTQAFTELTETFKDAFAAGLSTNDQQVQELVREHYEFCKQFWTPNREAYKSLALSYLLPGPYRDSYEAVMPGLAKYHYDAMVQWAEQNLT